MWIGIYVLALSSWLNYLNWIWKQQTVEDDFARLNSTHFCKTTGEQFTWLNTRPWLAAWLTSCRSLVSESLSDLRPRYLIQQTEDHDGEGCQADIMLSRVVTPVFNPPKVTADNEALLEPRLHLQPWPAHSLVSASLKQTSNCLIFRNVYAFFISRTTNDKHYAF